MADLAGSPPSSPLTQRDPRFEAGAEPYRRFGAIERQTRTTACKRISAGPVSRVPSRRMHIAAINHEDFKEVLNSPDTEGMD